MQAILEQLYQIKLLHPTLIPADVNVFEEYGNRRSLRRGSMLEARARGVDNKYVDMANCSRNVENAKSRKPKLAMQDHYSNY